MGYLIYFSEESGTPIPRRVYLPYQLPLSLYDIYIFPTTKGIMVKIHGRPEIDFEELITTILSQWEGEEIQSKQTSLPKGTPKQDSAVIRDEKYNSLDDRVQKALSLLQDDYDTERNRIIVIDWWKGKTVKETVISLQNLGFKVLAAKTIYHAHVDLRKAYPDIAPKRIKGKKPLGKSNK